MKNNIPNIASHIHISDSNLLQYEFHHIVIKFYHKISLFKINLHQLLLQGNLWKISWSLRTLLKILVFHNFFPNFSHNCILRTSIFVTKTKKCLLCWLLWLQNYQMTGKYLTSNTTFSKKVNPMKYQIQAYVLVRTWNLLFIYFTGVSN